MKRSVCTKCDRKYWAQTTKARGTAVNPGAAIIEVPSKPKTILCKKHAPPTQEHTQSAIWRRDEKIKRHTHRRKTRETVK